MRIAFIGGGNMATALIGGMIADGRQAADFVVVEPSLAQREKLGGRFPGVGLHAQPSAGALTGVTLVVLAVKPQQMREACTALAAAIGGVRAVLSIAAGTRIADISRWLGGYDRILRAMPNTPALIGAGITGVFAPPSVDAVGRDAADIVLAAAGEIVWCDDEAMLDGVTGVSGSGPAYVFYLLEGLEQAARELGFAPADARRLAYTTFEGAVRLAQSSELDPATLRAQVTSKGGTTERGVAVLEQAAVKDALVRAAKAAAERAREMGDVFGSDDPGPKA
jgi:pyrroline-5-carboxylate reductase